VAGVRPYFESVRLSIALYSDETSRRVDQLIRNAEFRCPVANLLRGAGVDLTVEWTIRPETEAVPQ
jgi:organic hydroperoxide reductase OsmC/OhrA